MTKNGRLMVYFAPRRSAIRTLRCRSPNACKGLRLGQLLRRKPFQPFTQTCDKSLLLLDCDRFARTLNHGGHSRANGNLVWREAPADTKEGALWVASRYP